MEKKREMKQTIGSFTPFVFALQHLCVVDFGRLSRRLITCSLCNDQVRQLEWLSACCLHVQTVCGSVLRPARRDTKPCQVVVLLFALDLCEMQLCLLK